MTLLAALAAAGLLLLLADRLHEGRERTIVRWVLVAGLVLRLLAAAALEGMGGFPDERGFYDAVARSAADDWAAGGDSLLASHPAARGRWTYLYLLAGAYRVYGDGPEVGRLLGVLLGLAAAVLCGEVARGLGGRRAAALGVAVLALHPEHALWSATLSRDTLSTLLVLAVLAAAARRGGALLALVPLALLGGNGILPAVALAGALAAKALAAGASGPVRGTLAAAAAGILPAALLHRVGPWCSPEGISRIRNGFHMTGRPTTADFLPDLHFASWAGLAAYVPLGVAFVLLAPWPWDATVSQRAAYAPLAAIGAVVALAGAAGLWRSLRAGSPGALVAAVFAALLLLELALLEGRSGILVRHRLPLTAVLAAGAPILGGAPDPLPPPPTSPR